MFKKLKYKLKALLHRCNTFLTVPFYLQCFWQYVGYDEEKKICQYCILHKKCKAHLEDVLKDER